MCPLGSPVGHLVLLGVLHSKGTFPNMFWSESFPQNHEERGQLLELVQTCVLFSLKGERVRSQRWSEGVVTLSLAPCDWPTQSSTAACSLLRAQHCGPINTLGFGVRLVVKYHLLTYQKSDLKQNEHFNLFSISGQ